MECSIWKINVSFIGDDIKIESERCVVTNLTVFYFPTSRDLAARNILVFSENKVKISDFGLSRALGVGKDYYQTNFNVNLKLPIAWYVENSRLATVVSFFSRICFHGLF